MSSGSPRVGASEKLATTGGGTGLYNTTNGGVVNLIPGAASVPEGNIPTGGISGPAPGSGQGTSGATRGSVMFIFNGFFLVFIKALYFLAQM